MKTIPTRIRPHRILVVDDHPMMRLGLRQFIAQENDMVVCGEAADARETLSAVERFTPDLVLLDITLHGPSGLDLLKDLRIRYPGLLVLVHSMHDETIFAERALRAGARGYLMKQESGGEIVAAIRHVLRGEIYLSATLRRVSEKGSRTNGSLPPKTPIATLTDREFEVFQLIGSGNTNRDIARLLHLSQKTVEAHRDNIKRKLNLASSTALNLMAVRWENEQAGA